MFFLCSLENWNQHFLEVKCIFDEFRVFWDTFVAKGVQMVFVVQPLDSLQKMSNGLTCTRHHYSDLQRCCKNPKETSSTSHILPQILAIPVRISGWTDSICIQLESRWFFWWCFAVFFDLVRDSNWNMVQVMRLAVNPPSYGFNGSTVKNPPPWWCQKVTEKTPELGCFFLIRGSFRIWGFTWLYGWWSTLESPMFKADSQVCVWINLGALSWYSNNKHTEIDKSSNHHLHRCFFSIHFFPPSQKNYMVTSQKAI